MSARIILDANVFVQYAAYGQTQALTAIILQQDFEVYATNHLLHEVFEALHKPGILKSDSVNPVQIVDFLQKILFITAEHPKYQLSPDYDDNYLFDLAIQNGCLFIISSDKALLNIKNAPVPVFSTQWFKSNFGIKP